MVNISSSLTSTHRAVEIKEQINWDNKFVLNSIIDKMVLFTNAMAKKDELLRPYQEELIRRIFRSLLTNDGQDITALMARQMGKSFTIAGAIATAMCLLPVLAKIYPKKLSMYKDGVMIGVFGPTKTVASMLHAKVESIFTSENINNILGDPDINGTKIINKSTIKVAGDAVKLSGKIVSVEWSSFCDFVSADKRTSIEGRSYHLIITDETQFVDDQVLLKSISPMGAAYNATSIKIGTPAYNLCEFYNAIQRNKGDDILRDLKNHFEFDYKVGMAYNPKYKTYVENEKKKHGEQSEYFRISYALEWFLEQGAALTTSQFLEYLADETLALKNANTNGKNFCVAGLDLGKDFDGTVLTILEVNQGEDEKTYKLCNWIELKQKTWEEQFNIILDNIALFNIRYLCVDTTGKGDPIAERLENTLKGSNCIIERVTFSSPSKHNMTQEFYAVLFRKRLRIPYDANAKTNLNLKNFIHQFITAEKKFVNTYMYLTHKDSRDAKDDYVDSLLLALKAGSACTMDIFIPEKFNFKQTSQTDFRSQYKEIYNRHKIRINQLFK